MNDSQRTMTFIIVAVVAILAARLSGPTGSKPVAEISDVGKDFYPDFEDSDKAKSLQVVTYNSETAEVRPFSVVQGKDGLWRIPTRRNYPADGKDRLAKTATSVIGIKREAFAGRRDTEHAEFGVLDPLAEGASDLTGIGNRITLKDADDKVLADYIIGKEVKGRTGYHYIRRPDEKTTYIAKLDIQVSTKFSDWIESDLLKIDSDKLTTVSIDTSTVDLNEGVLVEGEKSRLSRKNSTDSWKLDGIDEATEEVNADEVRKLVSSLDDLKITGVRQKPGKLMQSLRDGKMTKDQFSAMDLQEKGFFFAADRKTNRSLLIPKEGQMNVSTNQGVVYDLKFGDVFSGTEEEVEVGFASKEDGDSKKESEEKKQGETTSEDGKSESPKDDKKPEKSKSLQKSRYLFVTVHFDEEALGSKPEAPVKPEPPADPPAVDSDSAPDASAPTNTQEDPKKAYEAALAKYETDQKKFETDEKAFEQKVKDGEKLVKELNGRFADWYYVVSGESFENLRQGKKTLIKTKEADKKPADSADGAATQPPTSK